MKISNLIIGIVVSLILLGFAGYYYHEQIQVAPTFKISINGEQIILMGEDSKLGIEKKSWRDKNFLITEKSSFYMWHFWGDTNQLVDKHISIIATEENTGKRLQPFTSTVHLKANGNEGTASSLVEMVFPSKGIWELEVYVEQQLWGTVRVKVRDKVFDFGRGATRYSPSKLNANGIR